MRSPLHTDLPTHPRIVGRVRQLLREWLGQGDCADEPATDLILAVSEAVTNSVEHAYPAGQDGTVTVEATALTNEAGGTRAVVTVTDYGQWRPPPEDPGTRGRGMTLMRGLVEHVQVIPAPTGTQIRMTSHPCTPDRG